MSNQWLLLLGRLLGAVNGLKELKFRTIYTDYATL